MTALLVGPRVALRALVAADADGPYPGWLNDQEVTRFNSHGVYPYDREQALAYIANIRGSRSELVLAIELLSTGTHVGNVALQSIHPVDRCAELSILIGDRSAWGGGIGTEAALLLVAHAFDTLGLHRVGCGTTADNEGMQRLARKLGMQEEGRRREAAFRLGRRVDIVEFGLLASDYRALHA